MREHVVHAVAAGNVHQRVHLGLRELLLGLEGVVVLAAPLAVDRERPGHKQAAHAVQLEQAALVGHVEDVGVLLVVHHAAAAPVALAPALAGKQPRAHVAAIARVVVAAHHHHVARQARQHAPQVAHKVVAIQEAHVAQADQRVALAHEHLAVAVWQAKPDLVGLAVNVARKKDAHGTSPKTTLEP